jgi:hypothetical protein
MSVPPTVSELAAWISVAEHPQMTPALAAAVAWTRGRRFRSKDDATLWTDAVHLGTIIYGALLFQRRGSPQGFDGYDDAATVNGYTIYDAYTLVGQDITV